MKKKIAEPAIVNVVHEARKKPAGAKAKTPIVFRLADTVRFEIPTPTGTPVKGKGQITALVPFDAKTGAARLTVVVLGKKGSEPRTYRPFPSQCRLVPPPA